jgi:hypothetical protein
MTPLNTGLGETIEWFLREGRVGDESPVKDDTLRDK